MEIIVGPAAETLAKFGGDGTYDFAFIDADKAGNPIYYKEARRLTRKGGVIVRAFMILSRKAEVTGALDRGQYRVGWFAN